MDISHIAKLANLPIDTSKATKLQAQFDQTLATIGVISELDTSSVTATSQVSGKKNTTREDQIDLSRILPQEVALSQAKQTKNGYFIVPQIFDAK